MTTASLEEIMTLYQDKRNLEAKKAEAESQLRRWQKIREATEDQIDRIREEIQRISRE